MTLKTRYQYLHFESGSATSAVAGRPIYRCMTNRGSDTLGQVEWYPAWKQYIYAPVCQAVYSEGCLKDIADFLRQLNEKGKREGTDLPLMQQAG